MFKLTSKGNWNSTRAFIDRLLRGDNFTELDRYGQMGVRELAAATPVDTGKTADSWDYRITDKGIWIGIEWFNTNIAPNGEPIAVLIQYGHGTRSGTFVPGRDYINPAMQPLFDQIVDEIWKKVNA